MQSKPNKEDLSRISTLNEEIASAKVTLEQLHDKAAVIINAIQELENKILEVGGSKLVSQRSKVDSVKLYLNLANEEITKAEIAKLKAENDRKKLESTIANNTALQKEIDEEIQGLDKQLDACRSILDDIRTKVEAAQSAEEHAKEDLEGIKEDLNEKMKGIQEFRKKEVRRNFSPKTPGRVNPFIRSNTSRRLKTSRKRVPRMIEQSCIGKRNMTSSSLKKLSEFRMSSPTYVVN